MVVFGCLLLYHLNQMPPGHTCPGPHPRPLDALHASQALHAALGPRSTISEAAPLLRSETNLLWCLSISCTEGGMKVGKDLNC